jgi:hypothetical protein
MGVVTTKGNVQGKLKNCGSFCTPVEYTINNANNTFPVFLFRQSFSQGLGVHPLSGCLSHEKLWNKKTTSHQ